MRKLSPFLLLMLISITGFSQKADKIEWLTIEQAFEKIQKEPRKIIIDVYTDWCGWCKKMDAATFTNPEIVDFVSKHYYAVKLDAERKDTIIVGNQTFVNEKPDQRRHPHNIAVALMGGKMSYPTIVYLDEGFNLIQSVPGYQTPENLEPILHFLVTDAYKTMPWEEYQKSFKSNL